MSDSFLFWYVAGWTPQHARECVTRMDDLVVVDPNGLLPPD